MSVLSEANSNPYLKAHGLDLVDWHPWEPATIVEAKELGKPILLSIGFFGSVGCKTMLMESFFNESTAEVINSSFFPIKVDKDSQPEIAKTYQIALQFLTRNPTGWPITVFLDPENLMPFFGGTFFSEHASQEIPAFRDLLLRITKSFEDQKKELAAQTLQLAENLAQLEIPQEDPRFTDDALLETCLEAIRRQFDSQNGGFGRAPKFLMAHRYLFLLEARKRLFISKEQKREITELLTESVTKLTRSGIFDHLQGGFFSWTKDEALTQPFFEKTATQSAQMLKVLAHLAELTRDPLFLEATGLTITWITQSLTNSSGGIQSGYSEEWSTEKKFFLWRREAARKVLTEKEYLLIETLFGLDKPANNGAFWSLRRVDSFRSVADRLSIDYSDAEKIKQEGLNKMLALREEDRSEIVDLSESLVITNGITISALCALSGLELHKDCIKQAEAAADYIRNHLWKTDDGFFPSLILDEYAHVLEGLVSLLQKSWREVDIAFARKIAETLIENFFDTEVGGFYMAPRNTDHLIFNPKPTMDETSGPGNAIASSALNKLGLILGESQFRDAALNTLRWARTIIEYNPASHCAFMTSLFETARIKYVVIFRGPDEERRKLLMTCHGDIFESCIFLEIPYGELKTLPAYLPKIEPSDAMSISKAYVFDGTTCSPALHSRDEILNYLGA